MIGFEPDSLCAPVRCTTTALLLQASTSTAHTPIPVASVSAGVLLVEDVSHLRHKVRHSASAVVVRTDTSILIIDAQDLADVLEVGRGHSALD